MQWVATHTPTTSRFLVITSQTWSWDDVAEWFPALTDRESVTTVQGTEWIPGAFGRRFRENKSAQRCANQSVDCLQRWLARTHARVDYLFIVRRPPESQSADCCSALRTSLDHDTGYVRVFHSTDVSIYRTEHQSFPSGSKAG